MTFWYGLGFDEIAQMPTAAIWAYLERLPSLQAEARLQGIEAAMMPHVMDRDRRATFKQLERTMLARHGGRKRVKPDRAQLALMGIGYRSQRTANVG